MVSFAPCCRSKTCRSDRLQLFCSLCSSVSVCSTVIHHHLILSLRRLLLHHVTTVSPCPDIYCTSADRRDGNWLLVLPTGGNIYIHINHRRLDFLLSAEVSRASHSIFEYYKWSLRLHRLTYVTACCTETPWFPNRETFIVEEKKRPWPFIKCEKSAGVKNVSGTNGCVWWHACTVGNVTTSRCVCVCVTALRKHCFIHFTCLCGKYLNVCVFLVRL